MYLRNCPSCEKELVYKSQRSQIFAEKRNTKCKSCGSIGKNLGKKASEETRKKLSNQRRGIGNGFFNKTHSIEAKNKIKNYNIGKKYSEETNKKKGKPGAENHMHLSSLHKKWEEKYGIERANELSDKWKTKISLLSSGENNGMYGKPSPQGSGNGWSGWYKGWYFRSLHELSYMINVIERFNLKWEKGEQIKYRIEYLDWKNNKRSYHPDFIIENKFMIEIKPKKLWNSDEIKRKKEAAERWCKENNFKYKLKDIKNMEFNELKPLIINNKVLLLERYKEKFDKL
jgi:hypothetical protein